MGGFNPLQWGSDPTQFNPPPADPTQDLQQNSSLMDYLKRNAQPTPSTTTQPLPSTTTPAQSGYTPQDPTQQLEQQVGPAQATLGQGLQNQQQPQGQGGQQPPQADPWESLKSNLIQQYNANQQPPASGGLLKRMLTGFLSGGGAAMMRDAGLQTPEQQQQTRLNNITSISNAQALDQFRQAQAQSLAMVNVQLPSGEVVQMPANSAAKVYASQVRAQTQQPSTDPKEMYGRRLAYLLQNGIDPSTDTQLQQIASAQQDFTAKPPADTATAAKSAYMGIIGKMQAAGALPPDYLTSPQHLSAAIQAAGKKGVLTPAEVQQGTGFMATYTTPAATAANVNVKIDASQAQQGRELGYAFDPRTQQTVAATQADANAQGLTAWRKVGENDIRQDTLLNNRLSDVTNKINRYNQTLQTPLSDHDKGNVAGMLTDLKLDTSGVSVPMDRFNAAVNAENLSHLDNPQAAQNRLIAYQNAREAMIGYQRVLSGSARSSDKSLEMNLATLPSPAMPEDFSRNAIGQFKENLGIVSQGIPRIPGVQSPGDVERQFQQPQSPVNVNQPPQFDFDPASNSLKPHSSGLSQFLQHTRNGASYAGGVIQGIGAAEQNWLRQHNLMGGK
jgi:hypothetical protein